MFQCLIKELKEQDMMDVCTRKSTIHFQYRSLDRSCTEIWRDIALNYVEVVELMLSARSDLDQLTSGTKYPRRERYITTG